MDKGDLRYISATIYLYFNITQSYKKNEIMPSEATWMDLEIIILNEVSQTEKDKCHIK